MSVYTNIVEVEGHRGKYQFFNYDWWNDLPITLRSSLLANIFLSDTEIDEEELPVFKYLEYYNEFIGIYKKRGRVPCKTYSYEGIFNKLESLDTFIFVQSSASSEELSFISEMKSIKNLTLINCINIKSLDFLVPLEQLETLDLSIDHSYSSSYVEEEELDLKAIAEHKELKSLSLSGRDKVDFSIVSAITHLQELNVNNCNLRNLEFLDNKLNTLHKLDVSHNYLITIDVLVGYENIKHLNLGFNNLTSIGAIINNTHLECLNFENNEIKECFNFSVFNKLEDLNVDNNMISSLDFISENDNLTTILANQNKLESIESIFNNTKLERISVSQNNIKSISGIEKVKDLCALHIHSNNIEDYKPVAKLQNLEILNISVPKSEFEVYYKQQFQYVKYLNNFKPTAYKKDRRELEIIE